MIDTIFGIQLDENSLDRSVTVIAENEDRATEQVKYCLQGVFKYKGEKHPAGKIVHEFTQVRLKRVTTIFGFKMDVDGLDKHIEVTDNDHEFTQCPEYRLKAPFVHEGKSYPTGTLVHRSAHVQLKKNVMSESVAASF